MVMDSGRIVEYDTPLELLDKPDSHLNRLIAETETADWKRLRRLAQSRQSQKSKSSHRTNEKKESLRKSENHLDHMPPSLENVFNASASSRMNLLL